MRIGWVGFHQEGLPALDALLAEGAVVGVMTLVPELAAKRSAVGDYHALCARHGVPLQEVAQINDERSLEFMRAWNADVIFVIGWSQILGEAALAIPRVGMVGAHASLVPHNRGSAPINWAILNGEHETGNTLMWLASDVDGGDIIDQIAFPITPYDTCASLYEKVAETNKRMILEAVAQFRKGVFPRRPQGNSNQHFLPRRRPEDGLIDWTRDAPALYRFVRALTRPYPGARCHHQGRCWHVWQAVLVELPAPPQALPGTVIGALRSPEPGACGILVGCGVGVLGILEMTDDGGEVLAGPALCDEFPKGVRFQHE